MRRTIAAVASFALLALSGCDDIALRNGIVDLVNRALYGPQAPSGLAATPLSVSKIHLSWTDNSTDETAFKIERSPDGSTEWTQVQQTDANMTEYYDIGLADGATYYYRICASNEGVDSAYSSEASAMTDSLVPITLVAINAAGDSFTMGDGTYGPGALQSFSYDYGISKYEITNSQFAQFIDDGGYSTPEYWTTNGWSYREAGAWAEPGSWSDSDFNGANQPVVGVSWYEAVAFCNWRSAKGGLTPAYNSAGHATLGASGYRLPTEVEWEYAGAKGATGQPERVYAWGTTWNSDNAVCYVLPASASKTADVGSKSPGGDTPQGLADMSGNVGEWCSDNYQSDAGITPGTDWYYFIGDSTTDTFLLRGGAWNDSFENSFRCAFRNPYNPDFRGDVYGFVGFRVGRP